LPFTYLPALKAIRRQILVKKLINHVVNIPLDKTYLKVQKEAVFITMAMAIKLTWTETNVIARINLI